MEIQYYIQYILSWVYHNVIDTDAANAVVRILLVIGLVSLLVYRQYILFVLLCIVVLSAEIIRYDNRYDGGGVASMISQGAPKRVVDKDELTRGISISSREGFSISMPKIISGDATGQDHRRLNKFVEEDSRDFTDKDFNSKKCFIGSGIGGITMFGSNELIGTSREATVRGIYDFSGNVTLNNATGNSEKRLKYFKECVLEPIQRNDFREFKQKIYNDITKSVINIEYCLKRFDTPLLFATSSDVNAGYSKRLTTLTDEKISGTNNDLTDNRDVSFQYSSLISGENNSNKFYNIQPLNKGPNGDNVNDQSYSSLLKTTNESTDGIYKNNLALKQRAIDIFGKVYGYRKRIDEILAMMRAQTKDDAALLHTVRVSESIVQELRLMLSYLAMIRQTNAIITFEKANGIYNNKLNTTPPPSSLDILTVKTEPPESTMNNINSINNIFKIPLDDDTYNNNDEKRYLYGITYYFVKYT
jgi:hypothetical protein